MPGAQGAALPDGPHTVPEKAPRWPPSLAWQGVLTSVLGLYLQGPRRKLGSSGEQASPRTGPWVPGAGTGTAASAPLWVCCDRTQGSARWRTGFGCSLVGTGRDSGPCAWPGRPAQRGPGKDTTAASAGAKVAGFSGSGRGPTKSPGPPRLCLSLPLVSALCSLTRTVGAAGSDVHHHKGRS